ncbi:MAG: DUF937 domain-containing protein [Planctomycetota bacterium]|nr:DUF937 domain-containing protein [Planctomycetota bacterium]
MNIVDLLKDQLSGQVSKQIGGAVGINEADLSEVLAAGLPGLLGGLGKLATTNQGAGKIADAIGGIDSSLLGNLAGMVTGGTGKQGGGMLGNLLGGPMVDGLAASISKLTGVNAGIIKTVLGYLAPIILGAVGSTFGGSKPDANKLQKFFSKQQSNISGAMPAGFSLDSIPGFQSLASTGSSAPSHAAAPHKAPTGSTASKIFSPLLLIGALGGLVYYVMGQVPKPNAAPETPTIEAVAPAMTASAMTETELQATPKIDLGKMVPELPILGLDEIKTSVASMLDGLGDKLSSASDAASAEAMLPELSSYADKIGNISDSMIIIPEESKSMISGLIKSQLDKLDPMFEKFTSIPGIGNSVKAVIEKIKTTLLQMVG